MVVSGLISILWMISMVVLIVGLIRPQLISTARRQLTRGAVVKRVGGAALVFFVAGAITLPKETSADVPETKDAAPDTAPKPAATAATSVGMDKDNKAAITPSEELDTVPKGNLLTRKYTALDTASVRLGTREATERDYKLIEAKALEGHYQYQTDLAFALSKFGWSRYNPILGCAWWMVVLRSGSPSVTEYDVDSKRASCDRRLSPDALVAASAQADRIYQQIYGY